MEQPKTWLDDFYVIREDVNDVSLCLANLGETFRRVGNPQVSDELLDYAETLRQAAKALNTAISDKVNADLKASEKSTEIVLKACLSGVFKSNSPKKESVDEQQDF
jgi:hypothetical protein